jgi:hypothetical protein
MLWEVTQFEGTPSEAIDDVHGVAVGNIDGMPISNKKIIRLNKFSH